MAQVIELKINGALQPKMVLDTQLSEELKWAQLDLDLHLKASLLTGLISNDDIWFIPYLYEDSPGQAVEIVVFLDVFVVKHPRAFPRNSFGLIGKFS